ncbi:MAG: DUF4160 domain-containing protein [Bacteroidota bacterium]
MSFLVTIPRRERESLTSFQLSRDCSLCSTCRPVAALLSLEKAQKKLTLMSTVLRIGPYRFFFFSNEGSEPPHIHVERDRDVAKFWLDPVTLDKSGGFNRTELNRLNRLVEEHQLHLLDRWHEFFTT